MGHCDEADFRALHEALMDAIEPNAPLRPYFRLRDADDGGYLSHLVSRSQSLFAALPSYSRVLPYVREVTARYCELQALKHLAPGVREQRCFQTFGGIADGLSWWEGAAACGSTMPTFALAFGAMRGCDSGQARELHETYFPNVSAFHILLDYFIDQAEDRAHGELNFVAQYSSRDEARNGLARIGQRALACAQKATDAEYHSFAVRAMCGFYCSRSKIGEQALGEDASAIAAAVDVDLGATPWHPAANAALAPLLSLYRRVIRA
jgi:tetraprenyl-beta-curcumene synthase